MSYQETQIILLLQLIFFVAPTVLCIYLVRKMRELDRKLEFLARDNWEMHHKTELPALKYARYKTLSERLISERREVSDTAWRDKKT